MARSCFRHAISVSTATVATLRNGLYGPILAALQKGDSALAVAEGVAASPWGTGGFGV